MLQGTFEKKRCLSGLLAVVLLVFSACDKKEEWKTPVAEQENVMGRYLETELPLPEELLGINAANRLQDGGLLVFGPANETETVYGLWRSDDEGTTWKRQDTAWISSLEGFKKVNFITFQEDGGLYLNYQDQEEQQHFIHRTSQGEITTIDATVSPEHFLSWVTNAALGKNGDLFLNCLRTLYQIDQKGNLPQSYEPNTAVTGGSFQLVRELVAVGGLQSILLYDGKTGTLQEEIPCPTGISVDVGSSDALDFTKRAVASDPKQETIYFCDASGIYSATPGGAAVERLVDGELTSLNMPSIKMKKMLVDEEKRFLVLCRKEEGYYMLRYHYDATAPAVPTKELQIYSLEENSTVRQAAGLFQRENPEVRVTIRTGITQDGSLSREDALRSLSTELLAGKGPDILVLDDLPADSYIEQGALLDLEPLLAPLTQNRSLFSNVMESYRRKDGIYGAPARFSVPMLLGEGEFIGSLSSYSGLASWLEKHPDSHLYCSVPAHCFKLLYPLYASGLFKENGKGVADRETLTQLLSDIKHISEIPGTYSAESYSVFPERADDPIFGGIHWLYDLSSFQASTIRSYVGLAASYSTIEQKGSGDLVPLQGNKGAAFVPGTVLAINAAGTSQDTAKAFIEFVLSPQVLQYSFDDGLPTSRKAFEEISRNPPKGTMTYGGVSTGKDGANIELSLELHWPSNAFVEKMLNTLESIPTAAPMDSSLVQLLTEESAPYFSGEKSLEETVDALLQKLNLQQIEK